MNGFFRTYAKLLVLLLIMAACLLPSACSLLPEEEEELAPPLVQPATIAYKTEAVTRGTLISELKMGASFVPEIQESLSFQKQGGRLKKVYVKYGQDIKAGDLLAELDAESLLSAIRIQEINVEKSQLALSKLQTDGASSYDIKIARLNLKQQQYSLDDMNQQYAATQIFAPFDGEVVYATSASSGDYINAYQTVVKVANTTALLLVTTADDASDLPIGAMVSVEFQKQVLTGEVVANPTTLFNDPIESLRDAAIIRIQGDNPKEAEMGDSARIIYVIEKRENVLILKRSLINLMSGRRYVNVLEDGVRVEKDVEIGLQTDTEAEIVNGLEEGDLVIVN
ncbi:MAG TPA: efflux transporter periplasmic adaptor subunit [Clostridiales bacterium]|nr:efflux transporter periplasmic adaptor subunit [Clostridiales bacterium]